ncbi:MAG: monofunctional biosynthetic peptidoglycan transglycosylase [Bacteroidetes bacterium]|nr:monofunctional biosynthetic peptidoglycan transglycosylase [Bacteroidota bacterium]
MAKGGKTKAFFKILLRIFIFFVTITIVPVIIYKFISVPASPLMFLRTLEMKSNGDSVNLDYKWISIDKMSPYLFQAAIAAEDDEFMYHNGFDFDAMTKAIKSNQKNEKRIKGGSTISQQTAKNVFLWPHRDYLRKGLEAWFTGLTELIWGKKRIMEVYLNIVELGDGVFGVEAASQKYFKKPASDLTKNEAAALVAVFPNPRVYRVINPSQYTRSYKWAILSRMNNLPKVKF